MKINSFLICFFNYAIDHLLQVFLDPGPEVGVQNTIIDPGPAIEGVTTADILGNV